MSEKQQTCDERVAAQLEDRMEDLRDLSALMSYDEDDRDSIYPTLKATGQEVIDYLDDGYTEDDVREAAQERISEYPLGIDVPEGDDDHSPHVRVQLSWGGPSDEFRLYYNSVGRCYSIEYWFMDWFDGASKLVLGDDKATVEECFGEYADMVYEEWKRSNEDED